MSIQEDDGRASPPKPVDLEYAEKVAKCIYIAADKVVADDVSHTMRGLIAEIRRLRREIESGQP